MQFKFNIGTKVFFGDNCIRENKEELLNHGKRAFIVTGKSSGKTSGALNDIVAAFNSTDMVYEIFNRIENNPSLENVFEAAKEARNFKADFIIGVGGGSPLDASKAVAVLTVNDIDPLDLYKNKFGFKPLPVIAVPTTAGTGSEVTPYSILTRNDLKTKMSFGNNDTFPVAAYMDARYTESLPYDITVNTAIDALSHAVEGFLSKRSTIVSDIFAVEAIKIIGDCCNNLLNNSLDHSTREKLLYAAMLGGMTIAHTGTTSVHGLGYSLTYFKDVPHGKANGILLKEYLAFIYEYAKTKINDIFQYLKVASLDEFGALMEKLLNFSMKLHEEEIIEFAALAMKQKSASYNLRAVTQKDLEEILIRSFKQYGGQNG